MHHSKGLTIKHGTDVSKRAGEYARHRPEEFGLLVDAVQDYGIFMLDPDGVIRSWNGGASRIFGYAESEAVGKHFSVFYEPDALAARKPQQELDTSVHEGRVEDEGWRVRKDGSRFWSNTIITLLRDKEGRDRGFVKITRDMTDRRKIEELPSPYGRGHRPTDSLGRGPTVSASQPLRQASPTSAMIWQRNTSPAGKSATWVVPFLTQYQMTARRQSRS